MLLERDDQLATLDDRLSAARADGGSLVLIGGEAGAGKTSLVEEFTSPLGTRAVIGRCDPLATPAPLSPLRDFVDVGTDTGVELFATVLDRYGSSREPTVMVLEDVHWADQATLDFIRYVGRRIGDTTLVLLCTYRDDEVGGDHELRTVLGQLARLGTTVRLTVPMLSIEAVRNLSASTSLDPEALHHLTGGNAFFVTEIIAAGGSPPDSLHDAVLARVGELSPGARGVIEAVSITPRSLDLQRAFALGHRAADVDAAIDSGVIFADRQRLVFRHELTRAAVEKAIPPARRHELHQSILRLLADEPDPDHLRLAHHAIEAQAPDLIAQHAPVAAREAGARGSTREAAALLQAAVAHADQHPPGNAAALRVELGVELLAMDHPGEALEQFELAITQFATLGAGLRHVDALRWACQAYGHLGRPTEAMRCSREAVAIAEQQEPSEELVLALNTVAARSMLGRRTAEGLAFADRAAQLAEDLGLRQAQHAVDHTRACLELVGRDTDRGIDLLQRSAETAVGLDASARVRTLINLGSGAGEVRRYEIAAGALVDAEALAVAHDLDASAAYARAWLARVAFEQGRWNDAVAYASLVEATATNRHGYALLTARAVLGRVRVRRGDPGGAELLAEILSEFRGHELQYRWSAVAGMAEHYWYRREVEAMVSVLAEPFEEALDTDSEWARGELAYWMWKAGEITEAPLRTAAPFAAQISGEAGRAVELWERTGAPYEAALARSEGSPGAAIEALGVLDALGARPLADRVRFGLRSAGVERIPRGPIPATQAHPFGLTERQAEVLDLIVDGLSNRQIADRLYVSKKTVEHHVSAVYAKLGVDNRTQAVAAARQAAN